MTIASVAPGAPGSVLGPVLYTVFVNGVPYTNRPPIVDAQLVQQYGKHDMFYLRIEYPQSQGATLSALALWPDDTPVGIQWGRVPDVTTWYGYVNNHEVNSVSDSGTNAVQVTYACIGTSSVLNPGVSRKWEQVSPTYIATTIAQENSLRAVTTPNSQGLVLNYEAQIGESNFQFLNRIADKTGYRFWCSGGTLYMVSPVVAIEGTGSGAVPLFTQNKVPNILDTCRNFKFLAGKNLPGSVVAHRAIFGIDQNSGQRFSAVNSPGDTNRAAIKTSYASQSYADAKARVDAWAALSQFWIGATAQLYGSTSVYPGKLVQLTGTALPDNASGFWLVSQVTQEMSVSFKDVPNLDVFTTSVTMLRNTAETNTVVLANTQPVNPEFVAMTVSNGQWVATAQAPVVLA
jgi:hypothetical protein